MKLTFFLTGERPSVTAVPSDWNNVRQCLMSRVGGVSKNKNDYRGMSINWEKRTNFRLLFLILLFFIKVIINVMSPSTCEKNIDPKTLALMNFNGEYLLETFQNNVLQLDYQAFILKHSEDYWPSCCCRGEESTRLSVDLRREMDFLWLSWYRRYFFSGHSEESISSSSGQASWITDCKSVTLI